MAKQRVLTPQMAVFLYKSKLTNPTLSAGTIAKLIGVNDKTIRDVWCGRTWARETKHLDPTRRDKPNPPGAGRPIGAKDKKPRARQPTIDNLLAAWECTGSYPVVDALMFY
jgi:hypothetical protein